MALGLAAVACLTPLNTQAEMGIPVPDRKPVSEDAGATFNVPLPSKKPVLEINVSDVVSDNIVLASLEAAPVPRKKPAFEKQQEIEPQAEDVSFKAPKESSNPIDPISKGQAETYARIFAFQTAGDMKSADKELRNIKDERLLGHVLFQRYMHPTAYKTSFEELKYWLDLYADHPGADKIYKMASAKRPADYSGNIRTPETSRGIGIVREPTVERAKRYRSTVKRSSAEHKEVRALHSEIRKNVRKGSPTHALKVLKNSKIASKLDDVEIDRFKAQIAAGYFYANKDKDALKLARQALERSGDKAPFAGWIAGLASWRMENYERAAAFFEVTASSEYASGWTNSAGAFWAARAHMKTANVKQVSKWLGIAYKHPHTFYGLLAGRALGHDHEFNWNLPTFTRDNFKILNKDAKGRRALALVAAKQPHMAEEELVRIDAQNNSKLSRSLLAYAGFADLPALAYRLGGVMSERGDGQLYDMALYPVSPWEPSNGFKVDPALVHAIMRQESRFNPHAENPSGATGLMQLMPATAKYISGKDYSGVARHQLKNPQANLDLGQKYLRHLIRNNLVRGDIIKLLVSYNAGPGNLQKWQRQMGKDIDPLMFIEMIPIKETRDYVEHVLSNYWIYRMRDKKQTQTLDILAQGQWPSYLEAREIEEYEIALKP